MGLFIIVTKKGNILLVESKGDDRDNSDSAMKIELGKQWEAKSGSGYKYLMVFDKAELNGAYPLDKGLNIISDL
jgi:type III restriction enzyme